MLIGVSYLFEKKIEKRDSSWRDLQAFAPLRPQYLSKFLSICIGMFNIFYKYFAWGYVWKEWSKFREIFIKIWAKFNENDQILQNFAEKNTKKFDECFLKYWGLSGPKACKSCRSRQELSNENIFLQNLASIQKRTSLLKFWSFGWEIRVRFDIEPFN